MLNFGWYSVKNSPPSIRFGTDKELKDSKMFIGTCELGKKVKGQQFYTNKVTVTGIERNSVYYYQRHINGKWDEIVEFKTYDPDNFKFIFVGDPQIGGSSNRASSKDKHRLLSIPEGTRNDAFNWNMTITNSFKFTGQPSLLLSAGDQADKECSDLAEESYYHHETQFSALLLPEKMRTIPSAMAVGNHESYTDSYRYHFNLPNPTIDFVGKSSIVPGYNYFFKFNNVLVVVLETNYNKCVDFIKTIEEAITKYPETEWRIAMFHHDIYGNGYMHSSEPYIKDTLRKCLTEQFDKYHFDLVINGHDHVYTASHFISYTKETGGYNYHEIEKGKVNKSPKGTLFVTANCSTGSKLYTFVNESRDYVYNYEQTFTSTFGVLDFLKEDGKVRLTVNSYEVESLKLTDGPYIIEKPEGSYANSSTKSEEVEPQIPSSFKEEERIPDYPPEPEDRPVPNLPDIEDIIDYIHELQDAQDPDSLKSGNTKYFNQLDDDDDCWAIPLGYPCCQNNRDIYYSDEHGNWSYEDGWCGIRE